MNGLEAISQCVAELLIRYVRKIDSRLTARDYRPRDQLHCLSRVIPQERRNRKLTKVAGRLYDLDRKRNYVFCGMRLQHSTISCGPSSVPDMMRSAFLSEVLIRDS
ncbi:hypothetical protein J6590_064142 [Homalodisca vitripennis]|nr:hypothetical protein J6590_064142 [Homalodisca vitripennis]